MANVILTDIMGTTSPASYARKGTNDFAENGTQYIQDHADAREIAEQIRAQAGLASIQDVTAFITQEIKCRRFRPEHLALAGMVNVEGYAQGRLHGEFYDDVPVAMQRWTKNGKGIYTFGNGSARSQREMFRTAPQGDLSLYVAEFFDTDLIGSKYERGSFLNIADRIGQDPSKILYVADVEKELDAANAAGYEVRAVVRPGNIDVPSGRYPIIHSFEEIKE